jgi:hypothetical protein
MMDAAPGRVADPSVVPTSDIHKTPLGIAPVNGRT